MNTSGDTTSQHVQELDRVLLRLGLADDTKICDVLRLLLPQLFQRLIRTPSADVSSKILEILSHLVKRLKSLPTIQIALPVVALLPYLDPAPSDDVPALHVTYARNFSLLFVEMGFGGNLSNDDKAIVLTTIVRGMATRSPAYQDAVFRMFIHAFLRQDTPVTLDNTSLWSCQDVAVLLDFFLDVMLCPSTSQSRPRTERLARTKVATLEPASRTDVQLKLVQFLKLHSTSSSNLDATVWFAHMAAGAAADHHSISTYCQEELSRLIKYHHEALDTAAAITPLCHLILGSQMPSVDGGVTFLDRQPIPDLVALAVVPLLVQVKAIATDGFPLNLQVICTFLFGDNPRRPRVVKTNIRKAGMDLCVWVLSHTTDAMLQAALGPVLFSPLLKLLSEDGTTTDESPTVLHERKVGVYSAFSILARRLPALVGASSEAFQRLMHRAMVEEEHGRSGSSCLEALRTVAMAYVGPHVPAAVVQTIKQELVDLAASSKMQQAQFDRVRGVLALWASHLQFQGENAREGGGDLSMRLVCLRFAGDGSEQVRELARKAVFETPLPTFHDTMTVLGPQLKSMADQRIVLEMALTWCVASLQADAAPTACHTTDVQTLWDTCLMLLTGPHKAAASKTLVQVANVVRLGSFSVDDMRVIRHTMLMDTDDCVCEHMAILLASQPLPDHELHDLVQALAALLQNPSTRQLHVVRLATSCERRHYGALCGLGMLMRSNPHYLHKHDVVNTVAATLADHLATIQDNAALSNYDYNLHSQLVLASIQALGAMGNLMDMGGAAMSVLEVVLRAVHLARSTSDTTNTTTTIRMRAIQTLGCLVYGLPRTFAEHVTAAVVETFKRLSNSRDATLHFEAANVLAAWGHVVDGTLESGLKAVAASELPNRVTLVLDVVVAGVASSCPHVRNSSAIWLFGIVASMRQSPKAGGWNEWARQLPLRTLELHELLIDLLNEKTTLTQECAVKALAMLFDGAAQHAGAETTQKNMSDSLFKRLKCFRAFNDSTTSHAGSTSPPATSSPPEGTSSAFDAAANNNAIENACYREVSNVAADVGDASVMYTLLYLSANDPMWNLLDDLSKVGDPTLPSASPLPKVAATTIASMIRLPLNVVATDRAFGAAQTHKAHAEWHVSTIAVLLVPRLFLLKHHPNPKIGNCMTQLWKVLVHGSAATIASTTLPSNLDKAMATQFFEPILSYALQRLESSRHFKYREAACSSLVDILNGRDGADVRDHLSRVWKLAARAIDDVSDTVAVAGIKLVKCLGELSVRVSATDSRCLDQVLPFLVRDGISATHKLCQMLCMGYLLRLIQSISPIHLHAYLSTLPVTLLECMSSLEMPELQYAQFHVQDKRQLEKLRVSLSQAGPVGELLQACVAQLTHLAREHGSAAIPIVRDLCDGMCTVLRSGVGLNTRVGSANFVATLVADVPLEMRQSGGAEKLLSRIFVPYITHAVLSETHDFYESDDGGGATVDDGLRDGLVVRAYCRAAAFVAKLSSSPAVAKYVRGILAVPSTIIQGADGGASTTEQGFGRYGWVTVTALQELLTQLPPSSSADTTMTDWCIDVFPIVYVSQYSSLPSLRAAWKAVVDVIPPTLQYSPLYAQRALTYACDLLSHLSWESRKQGASAILALASSTEYVKIIREWSPAVEKIKSAIPGRLWRGKGILLEALGATYDLVDDSPSKDIVAVLVDECDRAIRNTDMAYLECAIVSLGSLGGKARSIASFEVLKRFFFDTPRPTDLPPLIRKRMFDTLGQWWPVEADAVDGASSISATHVLMWLCVDAAATFHVWSVREAMLRCLAQILSRATYNALDNRKTMEAIATTCQHGMGDAKYASVRRAALDALVALARRRNDAGMPLVALVPYKEDWIAAATTLLHDAEPSVCHAASQLVDCLRSIHY
ncbi:hypothetical protein H310_13311 [Aphanomyces invadans]|uniref:Uncharacterized protein n=1 Tax=Aphanomyces invadans TaxID=157072 RepID=A0A024TEI1_9STRA|nr:hypothetical protein H310_13311 [Aphanomyces invadans]ETV92433.1 hypothetical protein H310_13311 [Aphanomyces invadans]|eukprot:XP_008878984.1 hypothetical protein H310_13311 [Aphanomyces invadans]